MHHPVAIGTRVPDGQSVALHLDHPALVRGFEEARPRPGDSILAGHLNGRPTLVATAPDVLDQPDRDPGHTHGGLPGVSESPDDKILLETANARYHREHPGIGAPVRDAARDPEAQRLIARLQGETASRQQATRPVAKAPVGLANPYPGSIDLAHEPDYIDGLADGLTGTDPNRAAYERWQASLGDGNPGAEMVRSRWHSEPAGTAPSCPAGRYSGSSRRPSRERPNPADLSRPARTWTGPNSRRWEAI